MLNINLLQNIEAETVFGSKCPKPIINQPSK